MGSLFVSVSTSAAEFYVPEGGGGVTVSEPAENAYVFGDTIDINAPVRKDLIAAGESININESVFRSVFAAGQTIKFNLGDSGVVQGSVRAAGNEIVLSGNFVEDVLVAGETVRFENARIRGEVYVAANTVEMSNSQVLGNFTISARDFDETAIDEQVQGTLSINDPNTNRGVEAGVAVGVVVTALAGLFALVALMTLIAKEVSLFVGLLIILFVLRKYNKTELGSIRFDGRFGVDFAIGLVLGLVAPIVVALSLFLILPLFVLPLLISVGTLLGAVFVLTQSFLPIYLANLARNTFSWKVGVGLLTAVFYLLILLLNVAAYFAPITVIIILILGLAPFGYVLRQIMNSFAGSLKSNTEKVVSEEKPAA